MKIKIEDKHLNIIQLNKDVHNCSEIFWYIIEELKKTNSGFYHNKNILLDSLINNNFYILTICLEDTLENDEKFGDYYKKISSFNKKDYVINFFNKNNRHIILPAFFTTSANTLDIIWVHSKYRRNRFGTKMVNFAFSLGIKKPTTILKESKEFWNTILEVDFVNTKLVNY